MGLLIKFLYWVFQKFAAAVLIVVLGLVASATWLFLRDNVDFEAQRREAVHSLTAERTKVTGALEDVRTRMNRTSAEVAAEQEKIRQADKVIGELKELESTWDKMFGNRVQQLANQQRIEDLTKLRTAATERVTALQTEFTRTTWERDGLEIALGKIDAKLHEVQVEQSKVMHYLTLAWDRMRGWVFALLIIYFVGPPIWKFTAYFWLAPMIEMGRPIRLRQDMEKFPEVAATGASVDVTLAPGERLCVKKNRVKTSEGELRRGTRLLLSWKIPFACFATGLVKLAALQNRDAERERRVTLSAASGPAEELGVIVLAPRATIVVRPSFLAGVVLEKGKRLIVRCHWQLFQRQAWVALQFRYFEFVGPCRLVIASPHGIRVDELAERPGNERPARRMLRDATIGFTPTLEYRAMRVEKFWSYYRGTNALFDDLFTGRGIFLSQSDAGATKSPGLWRGMLKLIGI